jgi:hypothetical protein
MRRLAFASLVVLAACSGARSKALPPDEAQKLLLDRNWVDRLPQTVDDKIHVFRFVPSMGGGVYQDRTIFAGAFELFQFASDGESIKFDLLHTGTKAQSRYRIEELATPGPEGVDLRLMLEASPRGPSIYFSWRQSAADLDGQLARLVKH